MPAALLCEAIDHGKSETRPLSDRLRGEERIDRFGNHFRRHPDSPIRDADDDIFARLNLGMERGGRFVDFGIRRFDRQPTAVRHGIPRIDGEVQQGALELVGIGEGRPEAAGEHRAQLHLLAQAAVEQIFHARNQAIDVVGPGVKRLAASEGAARLAGGHASDRPSARTLSGLMGKCGIGSPRPLPDGKSA